MFARKRFDTQVRTIESQYGIRLNARGDMLLGNLLRKRGFNSLSQLLKAYRCRLNYNARQREVFLSFHAEDRAQVSGFRLMLRNAKLHIDIYDASLRKPINSARSGYIKEVIRRKISEASVVLCLIGNGTAWRDWVDWELQTAVDLGKGVCGVKLKGSRGRTPPILLDVAAPVAHWDVQKIIAVVECAAARGSK